MSASANDKPVDCTPSSHPERGGIWSGEGWRREGEVAFWGIALERSRIKLGKM